MKTYRDMAVLYCAPGGTGNGKTSDRGDPKNGPCGSIAQALTWVEQLRGGGSLVPMTICLMAGEYNLTDPLSLRPTMSDLTIRPYGDGEVLISGGRRITGFSPAEYNGMKCLAAEVPGTAEGTWNFTDLYVNGLRAERPRLPEKGFFRMKDTEQQSAGIFTPSWYFTAEDSDLSLFSTLYAFEDATVSFNHYWIDEHTPVTRLERETGRVYMTYRSRFTIRPGQEYIVENVREAFTHPGEWYLDRAAGMLYYIPRDESETAESIIVYAPVVSQLVTIAGQSDNPVTGVRFENITFAYTRGEYGSRIGTRGEPEEILSASDSQAVSNAHGSVTVRYARNVTFHGCTLRNYGVHGFNLCEGCHAVRVENCVMYDGGAGGVRICGGAYGTPETERTTGCTVSDCRITHVGRRYLSACGVLIMHAAECDVIYNEIGDLYYTGVSCGWTWGYAKTVTRDIRIMKNHIHHLGQGRLSDMGGVYLLGSQPGTVVSGNVIHDITCRDYGGWALYTDEGSAGILLENNLCYRTSSNCYHQHYGSSNVVRNNIFACSGQPLLAVSRREAHLSILFLRNILYSTGTPFLNAYSQAETGSFPIEEGAVVLRDNILYCAAEGTPDYCSDGRLKTLADAQAAGLEDGSTYTDPLFSDPAHDDYTLSPDSPAIARGFVPFMTSDAGPRS